MDVLLTSRLFFREFTQADINNLFPLLSDPLVMKYCGGPLDIAGTRRWLDLTIEAYRKYGFDYWAVQGKDSGEFVGTIGVMDQVINGEHEACLAFMLGRKYWNKGYATEGAVACLNYAFNVLQLGKVVATVEPENQASISVLRKIGMQRVGETDYANHNAYVYFISKKDYQMNA